ncbi:MAG TPA: NAD-dependent epimerase/dehydratase family protein [Streptosporangiaceae bacterium]|nr:NAD-dependent epimerase/dehydratase family protein [Streptosporangiaceae bacterium]
MSAVVPEAAAGPVLVTGGSGFVGGALVDALVAEGRPVRALARSAAAADAVRGRGAEPVTGDVLDPASLAMAMDGCAVVYHAAGVNTFCLADPAPMERANVDGSANVIAAAADAGVGRVVYTSSAAAIGEVHGTKGSEDSPHRGWFLSEYERTKYLAEVRVLQEAAERGVDVVCVSPSSVQGPGRLHGTARLLLQYLNGDMKFLVNTKMSFLDIADCTAGHLLAEKHGKRGERYILNGATFSTRELIALVSSTTGIERRVRWLPGGAAMAAAVVIEAGARAARRKPPICREMIRTLLNGHTYDGSRAERELGLRYTPVEQTISRTLRWYSENGYLTGGDQR